MIDVHISRLRPKVDKAFNVPLIETVRGTGYRIADGLMIAIRDFTRSSSFRVGVLLTTLACIAIVLIVYFGD